MTKNTKEKIIIAAISVIFTIITSIPILAFGAGKNTEKLLETINCVEKNTFKIEEHIKTDSELKHIILRDLEVIKTDISWIKAEIKKDRLVSK